jgi:hypothetical protein
MPWIVAIIAAATSMRETTALVALEVEKVVMVLFSFVSCQFCGQKFCNSRNWSHGDLQMPMRCFMLDVGCPRRF